MTTEPRLEDTLAWAVLNDYERYLGVASPSLLAQFLYGAHERARLTGTAMPEWRIFGPLELPDFYLPIVARTGHPSLTIKWATALEMMHFSMTEAMAQLRQDVLAYVGESGINAGKWVVPGEYYGDSRKDFRFFMRVVARRPGMWGCADCSSLQCWLAGLSQGGDWLGLPPVPGLSETIAHIETVSLESYGSPFAGYRVYGNNVQWFLKQAGIEPLEIEETTGDT